MASILFRIGDGAEALAGRLWRERGFVRVGIGDPAERAARDAFGDAGLTAAIAAGVGVEVMRRRFREAVSMMPSAATVFVPDATADDAAWLRDMGAVEFNGQ